MPAMYRWCAGVGARPRDEEARTHGIKGFAWVLYGLCMVLSGFEWVCDNVQY